VEGADQVLAVAAVDPGLAAHRAVDLGQERGGDLDVVDAAEQGRGREPGEVAHHPAAQRHDREPPLRPVRQQVVEQGAQVAQALRGLARRQHDAPRGDARPRQRGLEPVRVPRRRQPLVGHDHDARQTEDRARISPAASSRPRPRWMS
jgi:hypothetical protein